MKKVMANKPVMIQVKTLVFFFRLAPQCGQFAALLATLPPHVPHRSSVSAISFSFDESGY
jgi:hypothetical protein